MSSSFWAPGGEVRPGAPVDPLVATEEVLWRALMRIVLALPRRLDGAMLGAVGITASEYLTLMSLSEAPGRDLRMSDLATAAALSASRMTRLVDELQSRGLVTKRVSADDGRATVASLTPAGLAKVKAGQGVYVFTVRTLMLDHVDPAHMPDATRALSGIAARLATRL
jgi:DNA-binding MarR family transcriptional regulator